MTKGKKMMTNLGKKIAGRAGLALAGVSLLLTPAAALAAKASDLRDLVGARAGQAEGDLESRGWASMGAHKTSTGSYTYWWNAQGKDCVRVNTRDGRYESITDARAPDCGQKASSDGVAIAAGAAALLGVLALTHKSHHRGDKEYDNQNSYAEFERGHRDGLYNHSYDSRNSSKEYADGYQSGVEERGHQSSYRPEYRNYQGGGWNNGGNNGGNRGGNSNGWNGGSEQVGYSDLVGARAAGVQSDLGRRGFRQVDTISQGGNSIVTVWWNGRSRQCVQMITADGRADSLTDIGTHPRCR
jgi:hypothetical protein